MHKKKFISWAALFREANLFNSMGDRSKMKGKIEKNQSETSDEINIEESLIDASRSLWTNSLYGKFYGRTPLLIFVQKVMSKVWKLKCSVQIIDLASGYFCFKFANRDDMDSVLSRGPWFLGGQILLLTPWREKF
ncbi:hypothetical protein Cni_G02589 [Canna indica]|uniref:DUF4283 domain-containing protein n=1 Tax=Canna indica TaxID=4628 RepID=A0AAQ3JPM9_9LILI|nr:hypothetical protein Cni_G02589 [Canna indica]